jgi:hypothetical protein
MAKETKVMVRKLLHMNASSTQTSTCLTLSYHTKAFMETLKVQHQSIVPKHTGEGAQKALVLSPLAHRQTPEIVIGPPHLEVKALGAPLCPAAGAQGALPCGHRSH